MKDLIITVDSDTRKVKFSRDFIGLTGENLQGNIVVDFDEKAEFIDGSAGFEVEQNGAKYIIQMTKNEGDKTYSVPIKSSLLQNACEMKCQVVITQEATEAGTPVFKSEVFNLPCKEAINATETIPEQYPSWVEETTARLDALEEAIAGGGGSGSGGGKAFGSLNSNSLAWESGDYIPVYIIPKGYEIYKITHIELGTVTLTKAQLETGSGRYLFNSPSNNTESLAVLTTKPYNDALASIASDYYGLSIWHSYMDGDYYTSQGTLYMLAE